jgi:hypothetical protein
MDSTTSVHAKMMVWLVLRQSLVAAGWLASLQDQPLSSAVLSVVCGQPGFHMLGWLTTLMRCMAGNCTHCAHVAAGIDSRTAWS